MNHLSKFTLYFLFSLSLILNCFPSQPQAAEEKSEAKKQEAPAKEEPKATLIDLFAWSGILPKELIDLQVGLDSFQGLETIDKELPTLAQEIKKLQWEVSLLGASLETQVLQTDPYDLRLNRLKIQLAKFSEPVTRAITDLSKWHKEWSAKKKNLAEFKRQEDQALSLVIEEKKDISKDITTALQLIEKQLSPALALGKKIGDLQVGLYAIDRDLRLLEAEIRKSSVKQTSPSMLSKEFYTRINLKLVQDSYASIRSFVVLQLQNLKGNYNLLLFGCIGVALLYWSIRWTVKITPAASPWYPFATCPMATTTFIVSANAAVFVILVMEIDLPQQWERLLHILNILSVIKLLNHIVAPGWRRRFLSRLSLFLAFTLLLVAINFPQTLIFIYVFYVSIIAVIVYAYQLRRKPDTTNAIDLWINRIWGVFPALILLSGMTGYDQFAIYFFSSCLSTVVAFLAIWMLYRLNIGGLALVFSVLPFAIIRNNQEVILKSIQPVIVLIHSLFLISVLGVVWALHTTIGGVLTSIGKLGFNLGDIRISPGFVVVVVLVFYVALLISRGVQALLQKEILPRYGADTGVQMSISRLVHYAILTIGFFVMLRVLGFKLEQLTLLGGALGVGIGFGLQAIVNNFASGLILLFERPIKVGDTIQIGEEFGEVKVLGLRATIIQTFDNAEIVVPNSDLVTGQVTNWTLANRKVRVRVPVGVAYGSDVARVMEILKGCAEANPMVLSTPKPLAFFLAFGASSLDFELRVWIPDFLDKTQVLSDLNQDIENEFKLNNIEIPFPQTDLHLRSVDEEAAVNLRGRQDRRGNVPAQEVDVVEEAKQSA